MPIKYIPPFASTRVAGIQSSYPFDAATIAWAAAVVTNGGNVSFTREVLVDNLIVGLKADNLFTKLDRLWLFAAENQPSALTDIIADSLATNVNSTPFTTDLGYASPASTQYVDSNFNPATAGGLYAQNSAVMGAWSNRTANGGQNGLVGNNFTETFIDVRDGNTTYFGINGSAGFGFNAADANGSGFYAADRSGVNSATGYRNGSSVATDVSASQLTNNGTIRFLVVNAFVFQDNISCGVIGGSLTGTDHSNLYSRLRTYMTAVGVP